MLSQKLENHPTLKWVIVIICLVGVVLITNFLISQMDIEANGFGIDWAIDYVTIKGGHVSYAEMTGLQAIPPWSLVMLLPLGLVPFELSWSLIVLLTFAILILSVPRHPNPWIFAASVLLLTFSHPALHHAADGNVEGLTLAGALLIIYGYREKHHLALAAGILLSTTKPQTSFLLVAVLGLYILATWPVREWLKLGGILAAVVIPCMLLLGADWLNNLSDFGYQGARFDISLWAALTRAGANYFVKIILYLAVLCTTILIIWRSDRTISRYKASLLIAASLLLAPYTGGHSMLPLYALGLIPLFQARPWPTLLLFLVINARFFPADFIQPAMSAWVQSLVLIILWMLVGVQVVRQTDNPTDQPDLSAPAAVEA